MSQIFVRKLGTLHPYKFPPLSRRSLSCTRVLGQKERVRTNKQKLCTGPIVISGVSGRFPSAESMKVLAEKLFDKVDMTSETTMRWTKYDQPNRFGFLHCLDKFDANFFGMTQRQANQLDPQMRMLLESSFEALIDAGMNPTEMRGSPTGVFSGAYGGESIDYNIFRPNHELLGYMGLLSMNFMIPARISFALDFQGPSFHTCTACSSSLTALEAAVNAIIVGNCEAAIVTGSTIHLNPGHFVDLLALGALSPGGQSKAFDESADGFGRAEAAAAILVQKEKDAKRSYARILNIRSNVDGFKHEGIMCPSGQMQEKLLRETYIEAGIDPASVSYIETHGTGTPTGDPQELEAIGRVFMDGRKKPLLLGSVKSNLGHSEAAAGLCSIAKTVITIQSGNIPPNLHFTRPKPEQQHLFEDGNIKVVTDTTPFDGGLIGLSSFGIGGTNYHCILEPGATGKNSSVAKHDLPVIIPFAGRTQEIVERSLNEASEHARNPEYAFLLQNAYSRGITGYTWRGYGIVDSEGTNVVVENNGSACRPVWIVFPGMGSQWNEMGQDLMKLDPFAESINRSRATLKNIGIDLDELLKPNNKAIFDDIHYAVLSITAMQMALYDTIKELGVVPEGFIGHSTGEFLCAYADDCFTAEETLLVADARGRAFKESQKVIGCMASVGMSAEEVKARLPQGVELACNNAAQNVTVSGEKEAVTKFVQQLKEEGTFAVVVNSCGIAAHSVHVQDAADLLKKYVADLIKGERARSSRWVSTSIPEDKWDSPMAKAASPVYFDNNLRSPVLFFEALQHVPSKAVVVEVSPKGFFQALIKESVPNDCVHVSPMTVKAEDKLSHFFHSVGRMHLSGVDIQMDKLYPQLQLPVSCNLPLLAPLVQWDHEQSWKTAILSYPLESGFEVIVDLDNPNYQALKGHKLEERVLFPATGYLRCAWMQFADGYGWDPDKTPIIFTNVVLKRATILPENREVMLFYTMGASSGRFEVQGDGDVVATGTCQRYSGPPVGLESIEIPRPTSVDMPLNKHDTYKEFRLRGYNYSGAFQGITKIDNQGHWAEVEWSGNWISFLDTLLQTALLSTTSRNLALPVDFEKIVIDPVEFKKHLREPEAGQEHPTVHVTIHRNLHKITCPGIEIKNIQATIVPRKGQRGNLAYEKYVFCPYNESSNMDTETHLWEMVDLVLENNRTKELKVTDIFTKKENSLARIFRHILALKPLRESDLQMLTLTTEAEQMTDGEKKDVHLSAKETILDLVPETLSDLVFVDTVELMGAVSGKLKPSGFLLIHSKKNLPEDTGVLGLVPVWTKSLVDKTFALYRKVEHEKQSIVQINVDKVDFTWVSELQETLQKPVDEASRIYVTSQNQPNNGVLGLVNCLRQEEGGDRIRCLFDLEQKMNLDFASPDGTLSKILQKDLAMTVVKKGQLGSYRHIPLEAETNGVIKSVEHAYISTLTPGDLTSLRWIESPLSTNVPKGGKFYNIAYAAMNFRDVLLATATIPIPPESSYKGPYMGFEFSGFDEQGNRVMGATNGNSLATSVVTDPKFVWPVPDHWTLEQAATVPVVYATVLYAFHTRGQIEPGQKVLIHAGTGGVGQAAISVALAHGCEVFTTVSTPEKREFIKNTFPQINHDHIGNSRDTSFETQFMEMTNGEGVDVILNSLADDKLLASVRCLAINGKFLEIGVYDAFKNTPLGMRPFLKNIDFCGVELYHVMGKGIKNGDSLKKMMEEGITSGAIRPLPTHVFESDKVEEAFRFMASGKHMGKLLIKVRDEDKPKEPLNLPAVGRCYFPEEKVYVIVGGVGGLGMEVANWMVERGARHLILTSRSGVTTGYQSLCLRKWAELGVTVETPVVDLSNKEVAETFIKDISSTHTIGGIFNSALVLRDDVFTNQDSEAFKEVCAPKATVTEYLDQLTRKYCPKMDYFVVFSSSACGRGNAEQTNYGWANSVMERICENRVADGLHGLAIQWGVLGQVGVVAEKIFKNMDGTEVLMGTLPQNVDSCLEVLDAALQQNNPVASSIVVAEKGTKKGGKVGLLARMAKIFGMKDIESLRSDKKLTELGMDSLVGVELKQTLEREYDIAVTKELLLSLTVGDLKAIDAGTFSADRIGSQSVSSDSNKDRLVLHEIPLVKLESAGSGKPVLIVHGFQGEAEVFKPLASRLEAAVYGFQLAKETDIQSVTKIAEQYIAELKEIQPTGPYTICGYSAGCVIAYEMALQLEDKYGEEVDYLLLLDGPPSFENPNVSAGKLLGLQAAEGLGFFDRAPEETKKKFEDSLTGNLTEDVMMYTNLTEGTSNLPVDMDVFSHYMTLSGALEGHVPSRDYTGRTVHIAASSSVLNVTVTGEDYNVSKHCKGPVARYKVSGDHVTFLEEDHVDETAKILTELFT